MVKAGVCKTPIQRFESARRLDFFCRGGGMVDAADLKSALRKEVWVRFPPSAHTKSPDGVNRSLPGLLTKFLSSRRQGISPQTIEFYECYLTYARSVVGIDIAGQEIKRFIDNLSCSNGGRHAYCRVLRAFYNWLYSPKACCL